MENLILQKQLMFFLHLANIPDDSLAGEVFQLQLENSEEGIINKCKEHLPMIGYPNPREETKRMWKSKIKKYIEEKNRCDLLNDIRKYEKLNYEEHSQEKYERKAYF